MKKAFITGISGFAGGFLAELLASEGNAEVFGSYLNEPVSNNNPNLIKLDLLNYDETEKILEEVKPDLIFHLAALTSPKESFDAPLDTLENNIKAQLNILEAVRKLKIQTRILVVSSAEVYGIVKKENLPINEETEMMPASPYAVSKITQDYLALQYSLSYKLGIVRVRPFNHIGPRQSDRFAVGAFAKKIAEIEKGKREPILPVGNLESKRDFTDVRDMVKAYILAIEIGKSGQVYNLGSGRSHAMSEVLNKLLSLAKVKIEVKTDQSLLRPSDTPDLVCDTSKFSNLTGWKPEISLDKTLKDTLDYWRELI